MKNHMGYANFDYRIRTYLMGNMFSVKNMGLENCNIMGQIVLKKAFGTMEN